MGGGGGSSSESTTQGTMGFAQMTDPVYGFLAAGEQSRAAEQAAEIATTTINQSIGSLREQFTRASGQLAPYTNSGTEAQDKLNWFLGLAPLNPIQPIAPVKKGASEKEISDYIKGNTAYHVNGWDDKGGWRDIYMGVGSNPGREHTNFSEDKTKTGETAMFPGTSGYIQGFIGDPTIHSSVSSFLEDQKNPDYQGKVDQYNQDMESYKQQKGFADQYNAKGPATIDDVAAEIQKDPNYQFQMDQGLKALTANSSAQGYLGSGRMLKELQTYGSGLAANAYGSMLSNLAQLAGQGQAAAFKTADYAAGLGQGISGLQAGLGDTLANSQLAAGQARASAFLTAGQKIVPLEGKTTTKSSTSGGGGGSGIGSILGGIGGILGAF